MAFVKYLLIGYKKILTRKGSVMYILHFGFEDARWEGQPGMQVNCMFDRLEGDLVIGGSYRVFKQNGSNFALAVQEL